MLRIRYPRFIILTLFKNLPTNSFLVRHPKLAWQDYSRQWLLYHAQIMRQKSFILSCQYPYTRGQLKIETNCQTKVWVKHVPLVRMVKWDYYIPTKLIKLFYISTVWVPVHLFSHVLCLVLWIRSDYAVVATSDNRPCGFVNIIKFLVGEALDEEKISNC